MAIPNHPVWPFEPNWQQSVTETLEWLTRVLSSPSGSEQRAAIRPFPRRLIEFAMLLDGSGRTLFDNMLGRYGASKWLFPVWQECHLLDAARPAGATTLPLDGLLNTQLKVGKPAFIVGDDPFVFEVVEVVSLSAAQATVTATSRVWPAGTRVYPMMVARLTDQPSPEKQTDDTVTAQVRFQRAEAADDPGFIIPDAGPMIVDGLITNAYHQETGRGGYFHHNSGTSEGQFIFIYALYLAFEQLRNGTIDEQIAADYYRNLAEQMLDALGDGGPSGPMLRQLIPDDPNTITLMHWLFAGRGDIPGQSLIFSYEVAPTGGVLVIPANASGADVFKVWSIYPGSSELLFNSPFSPAFDILSPGAETQIWIPDNGFTKVGQTTHIPIPAGAPASATWKIVYGFYTESIIPIKHGFEAFPNWTRIPPGYSACAPDTFRWFDQSMLKAMQWDARPGNAAKWEKLLKAMRRTAVKGQAITDLREVIRPLPGFDPIPVKGDPDGMFCFSDHPEAQSPSVPGANSQWKGYDFWTRAPNGDILGRIPASSDLRQVQIGRGFSDAWRVATSYQDADQYLYVAVSCSKKPIAASNELFTVFISATMAFDPDQRWYADIGSMAEFVAMTGDVIEFFIPRTAFRTRGWGAQGQPIWGTQLPAGQHIENFGVSVEMAGSYQIRLRELRLVSGPSAAWVLANPELAKKGSKMPFFPGALPFAINADLRKQQFVGWNGSPFHGYQLADFWWWCGEDAEVIHPDLTVADLPIPNPSTGALTFPISPTTSGSVTKPKHALLMEQQLMFLKHAQDQWAAHGGPNGFFAHTFVINTPARGSLGWPTPHTWVYTNDDPNTRWVGYQTRLVESLAELCWLTRNHSGFQTARDLSKQMTDAWLVRLNVVWPDLNGKNVDGTTIYGMPTDYPDPRITQPQTLYEEPHAAAHVMRACIMLRKAYPGDPNSGLYDAITARCWNYLEMLWRTTGEMAFTWSPDPAAKQWYGFWHGDIITTLAIAIDNPGALPAAVAAAIPTMRARLVETRQWFEAYGVGYTRPDPSSGIGDVYRDAYVLPVPPDDRERLGSEYERLLEVIDNRVGVPEQFDTARRHFELQKFSWTLEGRAEHRQFERLLEAMRGRATAMWVPTFMEDFILAAPISVGDSTLIVQECGFTFAGGPRVDHQDIVIDIGTERLYRRIVGSAMGGAGLEVLALDQPIRAAIPLTQVERVCFIRLMRLNHDSIEIDHQTDTVGTSTVVATLRSAPDSRIPDAAFYIE